MSKNLNQVYMTNPITSNASTDLMYFMQSPYTAGTDAGMTYANFAAQFGAPYTAAALTSGNDTNVTLTLGGTPTTALLHAASITAGWTGQLSPARGGTGVNNGTSTLTLAGNLATSGAFASTFTMTNTTSVTFPTSGTLATTSQIPTGAALTKADDTNVTLTLGGSPTTALVNAASITAGWTGTLSGTRGGTGVNNGANTATFAGNLNFANAFTTSGNFAVTQTYTNTTNVTFPTSGTLATTSQLPTPAALTKADDTNVTLTLGGTPATALLQAASITAGWTGTLAVGRGGLGIATTPSNGQIPIGNGTNYTAATLTAGTGISISNGSGSITVSSSGIGSLTWNDVSGTTQAAAVNNGYIISNASQTTVTLPATAAEGSVFAVQGKGAAGWILQMNTGQVCHLGSSASSSAGSLTSTNQWDSVSIVCVTANTTFAVTSVIGNLTVA